MIQTNYNPDVLTCLANLSNDEVFTPPNLANEMLDLLPVELWRNPNTTFLDPVTKSGVFLREIAKRLMKGLENQIPDKQQRINHIFTKQLYGIAITELTSLLSRRSVYCSKTANGKYSICDTFTHEQGNIRFERMQHTWENGKCGFCGANQAEYDREDTLETYAYNFIHTENPEEIFNMKFDVIVGNPPYQLATGGTQRQAKPIYQKFVQAAKKIGPNYILMIIPSRWFSGGMGLDSFREEMMNDKRLKELFDFESSSEIFPGVDIAGGVCYFLWEKNYFGDCLVTSNSNGKIFKEKRKLNEFEIFVRHSKAIPIIKKVIESNMDRSFLSERVSSTKPFGISTNYQPKSNGIRCFFKKVVGMGFVNPEDVIDTFEILKKWKVVVPEAPIAGQTDFSKPIKFYHPQNTFIIEPMVCCSESWIVLASFDSRDEAESFRSYIFTKLVRFLILQTVISQHVNKKNYKFVPDLGSYKGIFLDADLRKLWGIDQEEWEYIDQRISNSTSNE